MADVRTRIPAPPEALAEYEQLAAEVALFDRRQVDRIMRAWFAPASRGARRRYDQAVQRAEQLALESGRVVAVDDDGGALVAGAAPAYARLDDLLIASPIGKPVPVMVDIAYAMLTADLLDGADLEAITTRWAGVLEGPTAPAPAPRPPADDVIDVELGEPAPRRRPAATVPDPIADAEQETRAARRATPAARRRRRRRRTVGVLAFIAAAACLAASGVLLGLASSPAGVPPAAGAVAAVAAVVLAVYGAIANASASRIR